MPRAELRPVENAVGPCPSCGAQGHPRGRLLTEKGRVAWDGCAFCWGLAMRRNQLATLQMLCREADRDVRPGAPGPAMRGR